MHTPVVVVNCKAPVTWQRCQRNRSAKLRITPTGPDFDTIPTQLDKYAVAKICDNKTAVRNTLQHIAWIGQTLLPTAHDCHELAT
jgi:hypothetical protein